MSVPNLAALLRDSLTRATAAPDPSPPVEPVFEEEKCVCDDPWSLHDDGFGCTVAGCACLAGWEWAGT